jgi:endonuclease/exonuclease/phosphatase family metal-dependent hydrolase
MRLLSLNVALFEANNKQLSTFISKGNFDILCLQEVTEKIDLTANPEYVSKNVIDKTTKELEYSAFDPILRLRECHLLNFHKKKNFDFDFGGFLNIGNYVKSKYKIIKKSNVFVKKYSEITITDWKNWPNNQSRAVQILDLLLPNSKKIRILNHHGIWTKEKIGNDETEKACKMILALAKEVNYPSIIAGDFNLFPETQSMRIFYKDFISLVDTHSIKTTRPKSNELSHLEKNIVDYILVSKHIKIRSFEVLDSEVSDHLPLILDFEIQ